ncbi:amino acid/amide ABC transporter ATP-binding protein 2, HAAT family [Rhizobiales bacterium GAS113]|nr:amino acid/amide ABC transporter ATP-binding protein 2, HAAT family [Rhizobiales bacterium GAS113]
MPLLELKGVAVGYAGATVLKNVALTLEPGEIVTLVGANGAGKSTLVKSISGLLRPVSGTILLDGEAIDNLPAAQRLRRGIAHVPEGRQVFAGMTVAENLALGAYLQRGEDGIATRLAEMCRLFPILGERLETTAGNFSGGQQQMLAIARGLMSKPRVLLLDEPSLGVAPLLVAEIFQLICRLRDQGLTILLAEQNARQALAIADRGYVFENGLITMSGAAQELLASPDIARRYLGTGSGMDVAASEAERMAGRLRDCVW